MNRAKYLAAWLLLAVSAHADSARPVRIAVAEFELNDLAGIQPTPAEEIERTASVAPLLRAALARKPGYEIVDIGATEWRQADQGFGYLFEHSDEAAKVAARHDADFLAVGRVHKPSYLFAYLQVRLVDVKRAERLGAFVVEVKGAQRFVTDRGAARLAEQIDQALKSNSSNP
jgi:hypothetical protein